MPKTLQNYWKPAIMHPGHVAYTNIKSNEVVLESNIILKDIKFRTDCKMTSESARNSVIALDQVIQDNPDREDAIELKTI